MLEIGSRITAEVERIAPYGAFLQHGDHTIVVLLPEIAWRPVEDVEKVLKVGQRVDVLVLRANYEARQFVGSIRRLHQDQNPYRELSRLDFGTVIQCHVSFINSVDVQVEVSNGAYGVIPVSLMKTPVGIGDQVNVVITDLQVDEGVLRLRPAATEGRKAASG